MTETARPGTPRSPGYRRRLFVQILAMALVALGTGGITLTLQFRESVETETERLGEISRSRARLIEAILGREIEAHGGDLPSPRFVGSLAQLLNAQSSSSGFGETGEFTFGERMGDSIRFLLYLRHQGNDSLLTIPFGSDLAEPMRRALSGEAGVGRAMDYHGIDVLAAFEPVQVEGHTLGLVAKMDYSEIRGRLLPIGIKAGLMAFLLIGLGAYLINRVGNPLIRALERRERLYRELFEDSPSAILRTSPDGTILAGNEAAAALLRIPVEDLVGTNALEFYENPEQRTELMGILRDKGHIRGMQLDLLRRDGSIFQSLVTARLRAGDTISGDSLEVVLTDITELRVAQEARVESENRLQALYDSVQAGVVLQAASGEIVHANPIALEIFGMQAEEVEGRDSTDPAWEMIDEEGNPVPGEDHPSMITLRTGEPVRGAVRGLFSGDPDRTRWLIINTEPARLGPSGEVEEVAATFLDITELRKADAALRESREWAQRYLDVAEVMLIALDIEGRIKMINRKGCELLEASEEELVGLDWFENFLPTEVVPEVREVFKQAYSGEVDPVEYYENEIVTSTGKIRAMAWHNSLLRAATGEIEGLFSSGEDITARKLAEERVAENAARFRALFEDSPISIWEEDFSAVKGRLVELREEGMVVLSQHLEEHPKEVEKLASLVRVLDVNKTSLLLFGVSSREELLRDIPWHFTDRSYRAFREEILKLEAGVTHFETETPIRDGTGQLKTLLLTLRVFPGCEESWERVLVSFIDITKRKRAEEAVSEALAWQRATIEGSGDAIFVSDSRARLVLVNQAATELTGYSREQLLEMTIPNLHEDVDLDAFRLHFDQIMAGTPALTEAPILRADGTKVDTEFNNRRLEVGGSPYMHTVARDLTERREMERSLRQSEERFRQLFNEMQEGFAVHQMLWDVNGRAVDYRFLSANPAFERITGLRREEILGKTALEVLPGLEPIWIERYGEVARSGHPITFESESAELGGYFHASVFSPEKGQFAVTFTDISDRVEAERIRKENEARLGLAQKVGQVGLLDRDLVRDVEVWSETTYEILGLDPEDVEPGPSAWLNAVHPDDRPGATRFLGRLLHGEDATSEEYRVVRPDGEVRWVRGVARTFLDSEGSSVTRILATVRDITEEKALLDSVEASESRLRALSARLATVREEERTAISRELHDEVGQTLTGLRMDLSMERAGLPAEAVGQRERFDRLIETTDANIDFVRELSSRLRPPILDVMGLGPALEWQVDEYRARTKVRFHLDLPESGPTLPSDEGISLYRIAQEALTNLFRHSGADNAWISLREEGGFLSLVVEDDGVGVPSERADLPTSLGLLGMTERAMAISGDLVIEPGEEGGTRVRVTLPFPLPSPRKEGELL